MKHKFIKKHKLIIMLCFIIFVLSIGIGHAYLSATLTTKASLKVSNSWNVSINNIEYLEENNVNHDSVKIVDNTEIQISTILTEVNQIISFYATIENLGDINAILENYEISGLTEEQQKNYELIVSYQNDSAINRGDLLNANTNKIIKIVLKFRDDVNLDNFEQLDSELNVSIAFDYQITT